ncbi:MAG: response regulator receiver sensor hybrid histidine kinase [Verrucomicrobiales bacterium]|jgi:CheY-like chemotaxis protein|nr:response regulator receiver sensor hybrid histidine kinase [Verrucomicrobiales bacterium]
MNAKPRILIIDDNPIIHEDFRKIFTPPVESDSVDAFEVSLFGAQPELQVAGAFEIESAYQGEEALVKIEEALAQERPYALAFVDGRMPPGWDGVETIAQLWNVYPELQVIICTAYADFSWEQIIQRLGQSDSLLILKKPFDRVEVLQLAIAMTKKWTLGREARSRTVKLQELVHERTRLREDLNDKLEQERTLLDAGSKAERACLDHLAQEMNVHLSGLLGFSDLLLGTNLNRAQRDYAEKIKFSSEILRNILDGKFEFSKNETR